MTETATTTETKTVELDAADDRAKSYGILFQSVTRHKVTGRGVHNPEFPHQVDVWENRKGNDPHGNPTDAPYSYLLSARSISLVANPNLRDKTPYGETLAIGDRVRLTVNGYALGEFIVTRRPFSDPILVQA